MLKHYKALTVCTLALGIALTSTIYAMAEDLPTLPEPASEENTGTATTIKEMFTKGTTSGQIRLGFISLDPKASGNSSLSDFALGGQLKFETASLHGISLGAALYTSHSLTQADDDDFNDELASSDQYYDILAEAYIDYALADLSLRVGRQQIDTPFADTDDIRMTPHTFEAITAHYTYSDFTFDTGYLTRWQGVDAGYPDNADFGDLIEGSDGTVMLGGTYGTDFIETSAWYYGIIDFANIFYIDAVAPFEITEDFSLTLGAQFTTQNDATNEETFSEFDAEVGGELYGVMAEFEAYGFTFGGAYTHASVNEGEQLFGGFGGGPFYTNIDTLVANEFAAGQDANSYTLSLGYNFEEVNVEGLNIGYTFGHYEGGEDAQDKTADIEVIEHNFYIEYEFLEDWSLDAVYVISQDQGSGDKTDWDYNRAQLRLNYTF